MDQIIGLLESLGNLLASPSLTVLGGTVPPELLRAAPFLVIAVIATISRAPLASMSACMAAGASSVAFAGAGLAPSLAAVSYATLVLAATLWTTSTLISRHSSMVLQRRSQRQQRALDEAMLQLDRERVWRRAAGHGASQLPSDVEALVEEVRKREA